MSESSEVVSGGTLVLAAAAPDASAVLALIEFCFQGEIFFCHWSLWRLDYI